MKKYFFLLVCAIVTLSLVACGDSTAPETEKAAELRAQYPIYDKAVEKIQSNMSVTAEQADDIFIVLAGCGMDKEVSYIVGSNSSYTVNVGKVGEGVTNYTVELDNGVVVEVKDGFKILYPAPAESLDGSGATREQPSEAEPLTLEAAVDGAIEKAYAEKDRVSINDDLGTGSGKIVLIYLKGADNFTNNAIRRGMYAEARDILKALQEREGISETTIFWSFPLVDSFGNSKDETVMKINFDKSTLDKINFEEFDYNNIPDIANDYFEHTALSN